MKKKIFRNGRKRKEKKKEGKKTKKNNFFSPLRYYHKSLHFKTSLIICDKLHDVVRGIIIVVAIEMLILSTWYNYSVKPLYNYIPILYAINDHNLDNYRHKRVYENILGAASLPISLLTSYYRLISNYYYR